MKIELIYTASYRWYNDLNKQCIILPLLIVD